MKLFLLMLAALALPHLHASPIQAGQAIQITVQGVPPGEQARLNGTYPVSDGGTIRMWQVGTIRAAGVDSSVLAQRIESEYKAAGIYTSPTFQVLSDSSDNIVQHVVTVGGRVRSPGPKPYQKGMTLFQAVTAAGGPTEFGAMGRIKLYRNKKVYTYDLTKGDHKLLLVYSGDIIDVPQVNWFGK